MVIEVFPTAALPHRTSLTAFLELLGLCNIFDFEGSVLGFYFLHESHIKILLSHHYYEKYVQISEQKENRGKDSKAGG